MCTHKARGMESAQHSRSPLPQVAVLFAAKVQVADLWVCSSPAARCQQLPVICCKPGLPQVAKVAFALFIKAVTPRVAVRWEAAVETGTELLLGQDRGSDSEKRLRLLENVHR